MGILEDLQEVKTNKPTRCPVGKALEAMTESDAIAFQVALEDTSIEHVALTDILIKNQYQVGERSVGNHRRMMNDSDGTKCSCRKV